MIPSLVAGELKHSVVEYLATTFALTDDEAYAALTEFLLDPEEGIFRGPFLRVRLPFVEAPPDADLGVVWHPEGLRPYAHQLDAWHRLSGRGVSPKPTLITTGTGSGKSEGFLVPIVDHCLWARAQGQPGIKALVLYPMNALVADQERRIAAMLDDPELRSAGVRGGVWIGNDQTVATHRTMGADHLITDPAALLDDPPDILLTNYKMLDRLLTTAGRQRLWAANTRPADEPGWEQPLTYLVLDEFHSYDGAQGTDVAMLLRRLGHRLGLATSQSPLSGVAPVGTSATLGSSPTSALDMCRFAERVFGVRFDRTSIIGEQRMTVTEVCGAIDFSLPTPDPRVVGAETFDPGSLDELALAFTGQLFDDEQSVGDRLLRHHLTASLLRAAADRPRRWEDAVAGVANQVPEWGRVLADDREAVARALERFVALVSQARGRRADGGARPLFAVEVQVWIREVTRLLRSVDKAPRFRWADSAPDPDSAALELPSVYCTSCGRSGWMGLINRADGLGERAIERLVVDSPADTYATSVRDRPRTRTMVRANPDEPDVLWLDPETGQVYPVDDAQTSRIAVLVGGMTGTDRSEESRDEAAKRQECPSCGTRDAIRFLGSRVTTLASVGITQMFGSSHVHDDERKLLAFTDSVQDASHRAAFFSGRTHRFNLWTTLSGALQAKGRVALPDVADVILSRADADPHPADAVFSLIPPDLLAEDTLDAAWRDPGSPDAAQARQRLALRLSFDAVLEAGLRARLGRTLETTGTAMAQVDITPDERQRAIDFAVEAIQANTGQLLTDRDAVTTWVEGVVERLRLRGGIYHPFLDGFVREHGKRWLIWGGAHPLAPKFPKGLSAPAFFASVPADDLDAITGAQTWLAQWARKVLGIEGPGADRSLRDLLGVLTDLGVLQQRSTAKGLVWGLPADRIEFVDVAPQRGRFPETELRCDLCAHRHHLTPERLDTWVGRPCLRLRCPGHYTGSPSLPTNYYRQLYRSGKIRRVVASEHTGMLSQDKRQRIETGFKDGGRPDAPNVLAATPTLEMGIDIGDLSAVMLTAVPPTQSNYVQRVGRAGRRTGNAFVTTFAEGDPRSLYFLADPELMIAGEIAAPNCYLDAIEILRRQYLAFLVDRAAQGPTGAIPTAGDMPRTIGQLASTGVQPGGWLPTILDAGREPEMVGRFIHLFGTHLDTAVAARLSMWAGAEMVPHVEHVLDRWRAQIKHLTNQRDRLKNREAEVKTLPATEENEETHGRIVAELRYVAARLARARNEETLGSLERLGLLPNYTLFDDTVTLEVSLWRPNDGHDPNDPKSRRFNSDGSEYTRSATQAIRELAPGNWFYVDAHRVRIDAVDNGTEHEPAHASWRLCPQCSWAERTVTANLDACPRCGSPAVADQGSILTVLPMRQVSSTEREITARVGDETDDREREFHEVRVTVDIDPENITSAWLHTGDTVFGVEAARAATIRYLNLGLSPSRQPRMVRIAGSDGHVGLFRVCRYCGGVFGIRGDDRDPDDKAHHRTWCKVRSGARSPQWDDLALVHELETEAVRILLPVAEFESGERLASFKAALLLGLRDSYGGDPDHLRVIRSDFPAANTDGDSRIRFVVVHDTVPGGTGYLPRLADPERLKKILTRAVELITACDCQTRGKPGCHRCLYGGIDRHELPHVSRQTALEVLDEILQDWNLQAAPAGTITGVNLSPVLQSELERKFKVLLHRWADSQPVRLTAHPVEGKASRVWFDLRFQDGPHWQIHEQRNLAVHHTIPDFFAERVDVKGAAPVAIYLDGWEYHGKNPDQVDKDATRRASVRGGGTSVWTLTWHDVQHALNAVTEQQTTRASTVFSTPSRNDATRGFTNQFGPDHPLADVLHLGAFHQLMARLRTPDAEAWQHLGVVTALAPVRSGVTVDVSDWATAVESAAGGVAPPPAPNPTDTKASTWSTPGNLAVHVVLDRGRTPPHTAVASLDTAAEPAQDTWTDWLHLANLLDALGPDAVITTTRAFSGLTQEPATPGGGTVPPAVGPVGPPAAPAGTSGIDAALADCFDEPAAELARAAAAAGHTAFEVGYEPGWADGTVIEVAWTAARVGILPESTPVPADTDGWDLRPSDAWTPDALLAALADRTT